MEIKNNAFRKFIQVIKVPSELKYLSQYTATYSILDLFA
jgi:hypothetical protein